MYFIKLLIVILFSCLSLFMAVFSIRKINSLPTSKFSKRGNLGRISLYSSLGVFLDIIMAIITIYFCGEGEFGTGIEIVVFVLVIALFAPFCFVSNYKLEKRAKEFQLNIKNISTLNFAAFFKAVFALFATIFFIECR